MIISQAAAQEKEHINKKISPNLIKLKETLNRDLQHHFFVITNDNKSFRQFLIERNLSQNIISEYSIFNLFVLKLNWQLIDSIFIPATLVKFIDIVRTPKEETVIDGFDLSTNKINLVHDQFKLINGNGMIVSVKENKPDTNDIDLKGRFVSSSLTSSIITSHATIMSTIIAGAGNSYHTGKGVAWGADLTSSNFASLLPDANADYKKYNISVQNHSYGTGIENYYGADAAAYDANTISNPSLLHVFSVGNSGNKSSIAGAYTGIQGYANLTGSFKMAKNIITVGAIDSFYNISLLSSKGPAYDGRVRPEIVAFAYDGSSGAAGLVSGTAVLLQQVYKEYNGGQLAPASLIKSVLLNSADDVEAKGIDFKSGYGSLNAFNAIQVMVNKRYFSGTVAQGHTQTFMLNVPANVHELKITLCWNDVPANANDTKSLVNDLDLRAVHTSSGIVWQPWVLNSFPDADSLAQFPFRKRDSLNNTEQITIEQPVAGIYSLEVNGYTIPSGSQPFNISYQWDSMNQFTWQYPTTNDQIQGGHTNTLRWSSSFNAEKGILYYSCDFGNTWKLISENIDLEKKYFQWNAPDSFSTVIFRMRIINQPFISDTSTISSRLITGVGFNCPDSFSIHWKKAPNISSYTIYQLGNKYLEPLAFVMDTSAILQKSINTSLYYAVAPKIHGKPGINSYSFNYNTQAIGCYIKNFTVDLVNTSTGNILLELGTEYNVQEVIIEKWSRNGFISINNIPLTSALQYNFNDNSLLTGGNIYRLRINLKNGNTVYSQPETIYYLPAIDHLVYPNPSKGNFNIVSKDFDNTDLILYDATGQKVLVKKLESSVQKISVPHLKRGLYFIVILQKNKKVYRASIIIQ